MIVRQNKHSSCFLGMKFINVSTRRYNYVYRVEMLYRMFVGCSHCDCVSGHTSVSGVYEITSPVTNNPMLVECVMKDGYGYTVRMTSLPTQSSYGIMILIKLRVRSNCQTFGSNLLVFLDLTFCTILFARIPDIYSKLSMSIIQSLH